MEEEEGCLFLTDEAGRWGPGGSPRGAAAPLFIFFLHFSLQQRQVEFRNKEMESPRAYSSELREDSVILSGRTVKLSSGEKCRVAPQTPPKVLERITYLACVL